LCSNLARRRRVVPAAVTGDSKRESERGARAFEPCPVCART
jgi:hypothetical protein